MGDTQTMRLEETAMGWVAENGTKVSKQAWLGPRPQSGQPGPGSLAAFELFDCRPALVQDADAALM